MTVIERAKNETTAPDQVRRRRWTTAEYYKMAEVGILDPHDRVELIDGEVITLAPIGPEHASSMADGDHALHALLGSDFTVKPESPISLVDGTEPQPDLYVARGPSRTYWKRHPQPEDLLLVIEVSATSIGSDRTDKLSRYAEAGIPEYWIVDLAARCVLAHRAPAGSTYGDVRSYGTGESIELSFAPGKSYPVDHLLGPADDSNQIRSEEIAPKSFE